MESEVWTKNGLSDGTVRFILKNVRKNKVEWFNTKNDLFIVQYSAPFSEKRAYKVSSSDIEILKNEMMSVKGVHSMLDLSENSYSLEYSDYSTCSFYTKKDGTKILKYQKGVRK